MSEWFRQNRWLGTFLIGTGVCLVGSLFFVFHEKGAAEEASARFDEAANERTRLESGDPFPNDVNTRKMKVHVENFEAALDKLKEELKGHVLPAPATMAPNEFQSRLRQAMLAAADKARANRVKLPDNFALGFEVYTTALPATDAAPLLGQELAQAELLTNILIEAKIDSVTAFTRAQLPEERGPSASPAPGASPAKKPQVSTTAPAPKIVERGVVDLTFTGSPSATRRVLDQIASSPQQFYIIRLLHLKNEKEKGPPHEQPGAAGAATPPPATAVATKPGAAAGLSFIVGNEHLETTVRVELVRFTY